MRDGSVFLIVMLVLFGIVMVAVIAKAIGRGGGGRPSAPEWRHEFGDKGTSERPFSPTVSGPGIAIDSVHGWLWLATEEHGYKLIDRADIRTWKHEWSEVNINRALELWHNKIAVGLADLRTPLVKVAFGRDHRQAELWHARLTTWLNG